MSVGKQIMAKKSLPFLPMALHSCWVILTDVGSFLSLFQFFHFFANSSCDAVLHARATRCVVEWVCSPRRRCLVGDLSEERLEKKKKQNTKTKKKERNLSLSPLFSAQLLRYNLDARNNETLPWENQRRQSVGRCAVAWNHSQNEHDRLASQCSQHAAVVWRSSHVQKPLVRRKKNQNCKKFSFFSLKSNRWSNDHLKSNGKSKYALSVVFF